MRSQDSITSDSYYERPIGTAPYYKVVTPQRIRRQATPLGEYGTESINITPLPIVRPSKFLTQPQTRVYPLSVSPNMLEKKSSRAYDSSKSREIDMPAFLLGYIEGVRPPKKRIKSIVSTSFRVHSSRPNPKPSRLDPNEGTPDHLVNRSLDIPRISYSNFKARYQTNTQLTDRTASQDLRLYKKRVIKVNPRSKLTIYSTHEIPKLKPPPQARKVQPPPTPIESIEAVSPKSESPTKYDYYYKEPAWTLGEKIKRVKQLSMFGD